jgi:hypothetical protein
MRANVLIGNGLWQRMRPDARAIQHLMSNIALRHCERSEAIQRLRKRLDCFVALLLAMTARLGASAHDQNRIITNKKALDEASQKLICNTPSLRAKRSNPDFSWKISIASLRSQ